MEYQDLYFSLFILFYLLAFVKNGILQIKKYTYMRKYILEFIVLTKIKTRNIHFFCKHQSKNIKYIFYISFSLYI